MAKCNNSFGDEEDYSCEPPNFEMKFSAGPPSKRFANLRWPNTVFSHAFADAIESAHKDCKNKHAVNRAIILFTQHPHYLCYFSLLLNAVY